VLAPYGPQASARPVLPIDPMATPGVESVERQGAPPRVGLAEPPAVVERPAPALTARPALATSEGDAVRSPTVGAGLADLVRTLDPPRVPPADSYSLRLVSQRRLYDRGAAVSHSPSLVTLVADATVRAHPHDLDRLGASDGDAVIVRGARGSLSLPCRTDAGLPRGVVAVDFGLGGAGAQNAAAALVDASETVSEVRLESAP
jgi:anaerobic selenocysteine-containing dehydrogenase